MARQESDREDLLRETTALTERAEIMLADHPDSLVIGFRRDGSGSLFVGGEPVFQFNTSGELRRAYVGGRLIKAEEGQLVALTRERTDAAVSLIRHPLSPAETQELLSTCRDWLTRIQDAIVAGDVMVMGQVPPEKPLLPRIAAWLGSLPAEIAIARRPNVG